MSCRAAPACSARAPQRWTCATWPPAYCDGFFETGLNPWDMAAGSLIMTEAGGLIGNFTGESDYLYQRKVVAGNPKVYGQPVQILTPYARVINEDSTAEDAAAAPDATQAFVQAAAEPPRKTALRIRKAAPGVAPQADEAPL